MTMTFYRYCRRPSRPTTYDRSGTIVLEKNEEHEYTSKTATATDCFR